MKTFVIGEIGINHNGDLDIAKKLIDGAVEAGASAVKFQKRTIDNVYTQEFLDSPRESPWGTTQREQKEGLEFNRKEYEEIDRYCQEKGIHWFASAWDLDAQDFLHSFDIQYDKVASAMLTNMPVLEKIAAKGRYTFISTGMHSLEEIQAAVNLFRKYDCPFELMHCVSTYPMPVEDANLRVIETLRNRFNCKVGYSGHEVGLPVSVAAVALGATSIERHITLDRAMYGSDQAASVEISGFAYLCRMIQTVEKSLGSPEKVVGEKEMSVRAKLAPKNG